MNDSTKVDADIDAIARAEGHDPYLDFVRMWQAVIDAALSDKENQVVQRANRMPSSSR